MSGLSQNQVVNHTHRPISKALSGQLYSPHPHALIISASLQEQWQSRALYVLRGVLLVLVLLVWNLHTRQSKSNVWRFFGLPKQWNSRGGIRGGIQLSASCIKSCGTQIRDASGSTGWIYSWLHLSWGCPSKKRHLCVAWSWDLPGRKDRSFLCDSTGLQRLEIWSSAFKMPWRPKSVTGDITKTAFSALYCIALRHS